METKEDSALEARQLMLREYHGILSTHSNDLPGYPFGSVMPYCLDEHGCPIIYISSIAQHTKNIKNNPMVSLIVSESNVDDVHTSNRLTWVGDAKKIGESEEIEDLYFNFFPQTRDYKNTHDFEFYLIKLVRARFISGFGKIFWIKDGLMHKENPFFGGASKEIIDHMNNHHVDSMINCCNRDKITIPEGVAPKMAGVDSEGIHLLLGQKIVRISFPEPAENATQVRQQLMAMAKTDLGF